MSTIFRILITFLIFCFLGWLLCDIRPGNEYGWLGGIWHGFFFIPNFLRSLFFDALYIADHRTVAYNIFYGIFSISSVISFISGTSFWNKVAKK